ncbi:MAG: 50S ribosomal protein L19 [Saprospiraceae bacterium]
MDAIKFVQDTMMEGKSLPKFKAGDNISVSYRIVEGDKERIQIYKGDVIQIKGKDKTKTFTVRKISGNVGVERIFPLSSPNIVDLVVHKKGRVRRARLFYLRELIGKKAKIKEKTGISRK